VDAISRRATGWANKKTPYSKYRWRSRGTNKAGATNKAILNKPVRITEPEIPASAGKEGVH